MIRETTADVIRRRRGMRPMDEVNDSLQPRSVDVPVPAEFQEQEQAPAADPADVEQATAMLQEQERPQSASVPAQVAQPVAGAAPVDNRDADELAAAQDADRRSGLVSGLELAGRQLVGGITHTPVGQGIGAAPSWVHGAVAAAKSRSERAAELVRARRQDKQDQRRELLDARQIGRDAAGDAEHAASRSERAAALVRAAKVKADADAESLRRFEVTDARQREANSATRELAGAGLSDRRAARLEDAEKADEKQVAELAKASGSDAAMGRKALDEVDAAIAAGGGNTPGTGRVTSKMPDFTLSDEGNKVRQNAHDALAIMLSVRSGATVSPEELKRTEGIYGLNGSSAQFADGMKRLRRDFESALAAKQAGAGPKVKERFAAQGGVLAQQPGDDPGTIRAAKNGKKLRVFKDGTSEVVE